MDFKFFAFIFAIIAFLLLQIFVPTMGFCLTTTKKSNGKTTKEGKKA